MHNNRTIVTYGGDTVINLPQGGKESFRSTSLEGSRKAVAKRNKTSILSAIFRDKTGKQHTII